MITRFSRHASLRPLRKVSAGFTLVELMIAMTISLVVLAALVSIFVNTSRSTNEMSKTNSVIENGRFAIQLLQEDLVHAGYWGGYIPKFDDLSSTEVPGDVPDAIPNPCLPYANWDTNYRNSVIGIPVQTHDALPAGAGCLSPLAKRAGTDVLVVRHAETCVPGVGNCDADVADRLYFQPSYCALEKKAGTAVSAAAATITLDANASDDDDEYVGLMLHTLSGPGFGQYRVITDYDGGTHVATVNPAWTTQPTAATTYAFEYMLGTGSFPLHKIDCIGTGAPATLPITAGPIADKRRLISNIYYITDMTHPDRPSEIVPTLVRSQLDLADDKIEHQPPVELIEGVEAFRVELGIDDRSDTNEAVDYTTAITWTDPAVENSPRNRGDGEPDLFIRCTTAAPCTAAQLTNVVAVKLYVLARSRETTPGYKDTKEYCLGEPNSDGTCPNANKIAAANDEYKRHVFTSSVRLNNVSGRRETP